jgi:RHS repeat-associated protein
MSYKRIANRYEYDHVGRKIATFENINNQGGIALNHLEYNEIGQLSKKNLHNDSQATTFAYNERGWMKNSTSDQFSMELKYNDGTLPQFNGNISGQNYTNGTANAFSYTYDRLNRLTNAAAGNNLGETISYDVMGNISSLTRDNFGTNNYNGYNGSRLTGISGFTNSNYGYDANGNLTSDSQKNISLGYNYLNLPQTVSGSQNLTYTYNAAGEKLQKQAGGTVTNYINGIQYTNNSIDFIQTEEGLARRSGNSYSYEYNLSDHLGNVRVTFYQNPTTNQLEVLQRDDYYAFGLRKVATGGTNKYLYNGKELQEELGQYDYGARFYDPVIGRWNVVDPLSEISRRNSPYNYALNNPIRFIDVDGLYADDGPTPKPKFGKLPPMQNPDGDQQGYIRNAGEDQKKYDPFGAFMLDLSAGAADIIGLNAIDNLFFSNEEVTWGKAGVAAISVIQGLETLEGVNPRTKQSVGTYEVGTFKELKNRSVVGDDLDIHHAPQKKPAGQIIKDYDPDIAPSIALPKSEHMAIPTRRAAIDGNPRTQLAKDIRDLRNNTNAPAHSLEQIIRMNKKLFPEAMKKK